MRLEKLQFSLGIEITISPVKTQYERHGYHIVGRDEHRLKNGTALACIVMVKSL